MTFLVAGIVLFVGVHSVRLVAPDWRARFIASRGANTWKGIYSVVSLAGFVLIVYGFGLSRADPIFLWNPPLWTRDIARYLMLVAFILLAATYGPRNHIKQLLGHPMYAAIKLWALVHLLANGRLGDVLLFGTFLIWAIAGFAISRRRDRKSGVTYPAGNLPNTVITMLIGYVAWLAFSYSLHGWLIGVQPF